MKKYYFSKQQKQLDFLGTLADPPRFFVHPYLRVDRVERIDRTMKWSSESQVELNQFKI